VSGQKTSWRLRLALGLAILLMAGSMMLYPGGTFLDESSRGYSQRYNFLSDLGGTVALNYERNIAGAILMGAAGVIGVVVLASTLVGTVRLLSSSASARVYTRLAAIASVMVCLGLFGAAVTPIDRASRAHNIANFFAFHSFPVATAFLAMATRCDDRFRLRATRGWTALTLVLVGFLVSAHFGPSPSTAQGLAAQVITQKLMVASVVIVLWLQTHEAEFVSSGASKAIADRAAG
jgi:hypothetical protein